VLIFLSILACGRERSQVPAGRSNDWAAGIPRADSAVDSVVGLPADSFTAAPDSPLVLFLVDAEDSGQYSLDPIALIAADQLTKPPVADMNDSAANVFRRAFYGRGQKYRVLSGGEELGFAGADAALDPGCYGLTASAHVKLSRPAHKDERLFATNDARIRRDAITRRLLSGEDRELLYSHMSQILADSGLPASARGKSFMIAGARIETSGANPFLVGTLRVDSAENGGDRIISVLLVLDSTTSGYRQTLVTYRNGLEDKAALERYIAALDIDGTGSPELITRTTFYEWYSYTVYQRKPAGWQALYTGGGAGC
jgi:hypothetical protein